MDEFRSLSARTAANIALGELDFLSAMRKSNDRSREVEEASQKAIVADLLGRRTQYSQGELELVGEGMAAFEKIQDLTSVRVASKMSPQFSARLSTAAGDGEIYAWSSTIVRAR